MTFLLDNVLVIGIASSAMFNLGEAEQIFELHGEEAYRSYQEQHKDVHLERGVAFSFIKRLLSLNNLSSDPENHPLVEVVLLSHNNPDTGLRVMNSIKHYKLGISRALFLQGRAPYKYIPALNISLFLSANSSDVEEAIKAKYPAGLVLESLENDDENDLELRIAFDFDGVIIDDESEIIMQETHDLTQFHNYELLHVLEPHHPGPLAEFFKRISLIQKIEIEKAKSDKEYKLRLRVSIVTARNAPSHERVLNTLKNWGIVVNEAFFLGGIEKAKVLEVLKPHIFFDDRLAPLAETSKVIPSVHIPFGVMNRRR